MLTSVKVKRTSIKDKKTMYRGFLFLQLNFMLTLFHLKYDTYLEVFQQFLCQCFPYSTQGFCGSSFPFLINCKMESLRERERKGEGTKKNSSGTMD